MSTDDADGVDTEPTPEEDLKALVRKDVDPHITAMAKRALRRIQEGEGSS